MKSVAGVFQSRTDAERALAELRSLGIPVNHTTLLTPQTTEQELENVPKTMAEPPGIGAALGAVVGGAVGLAGGFELSTVLAGALIPGIGPVVAAGALGAAVLGAIGAVGGGVAGSKVDSDMSEGLPEDELYVYEDALRQGRSVVVALVDSSKLDDARAAFERAGAESIDRAREMWWLGARDVEKEHYTADGGDFERDEPTYRAGFEAAQRISCRGKTRQECRALLAQLYPRLHDKPAFARGFERGQHYRDSIARAGSEDQKSHHISGS
jgi:hypothetical protein